MAIDRIENIPVLYHFTDKRNLPSILKMGGLYPLSRLQELKIEIPAPGGNDWSHDADALKGVDSYVHLCFRNVHPMEFIARRDGRIEETVFLQIDPSVMQFSGVRFTDDVSNKAGVESVPIADANPRVDFEVLYFRREWNPEIQARLAKTEKYEVLVPHIIPLSLIRNL